MQHHAASGPPSRREGNCESGCAQSPLSLSGAGPTEITPASLEQSVRPAAQIGELEPSFSNVIHTKHGAGPAGVNVEAGHAPGEKHPHPTQPKQTLPETAPSQRGGPFASEPDDTQPASADASASDDASTIAGRSSADASGSNDASTIACRSAMPPHPVAPEQMTAANPARRPKDSNFRNRSSDFGSGTVKAYAASAVAAAPPWTPRQAGGGLPMLSPSAGGGMIGSKQSDRGKVARPSSETIGRIGSAPVRRFVATAAPSKVISIPLAHPIARPRFTPSVLREAPTRGSTRAAQPPIKARVTSRSADGSAGDADYGTIGARYATYRRPDPRIASRIHAALGPAGAVLNVGAGAGSYEPIDRAVIAVEPSASMRAQRPSHLPPAVDATAEHLPFPDRHFDASMATFAIHQWCDLRAGLAEMRRVTRGPVVIVTCDPDALDRFWLHEYAPEVTRVEAGRYPPIASIAATLSGRTEVLHVPIPLDCRDGFNEAYYGRPAGTPPR
jgi:SAM-dependent methyltransferase